MGVINQLERALGIITLVPTAAASLLSFPMKAASPGKLNKQSLLFFPDGTSSCLHPPMFSRWLLDEQGGRRGGEVELGMARLQCHRERTRGRLAGKASTMQSCQPSRDNWAKFAGRGCLPQLSTCSGCSSSNRKVSLRQKCGSKRRNSVVPVAQAGAISYRR